MICLDIGIINVVAVGTFRELLVGRKAQLQEVNLAALARGAELAAEINQSAENIGARRLHTVLERLLEELSFDAPDRAGEAVEVTADMVTERLSELIGDRDLARYIL